MDATDWWSIEIMVAERAETSAASWRAAHAPSLTESLVTNRARQWMWTEHTWGVVLEVAFGSEEHWLAWRALPGTQAALDAVPDPVAGLLVHRGHGGACGAYVPRVPSVPPAGQREVLPEPV